MYFVCPATKDVLIMNPNATSAITACQKINQDISSLMLDMSVQDVFITNKDNIKKKKP